MERANNRLPIFTKRFRELQGKQSNTEFADFLGISRQTVGFYFNGDRVPDAITLTKISERCGVSTDWLLGLSNVQSVDGKLKQVCSYTGLSESTIDQLHKMSLDNSYINKLGIYFIEGFLDGPIILFEDCVWRSALADIQARNAKLHPTYRDGIAIGLSAPFEWFEERDEESERKWQEERKNSDKRLIEEAIKPKGQASSHIKISAYEYAQFYRDRAMKVIEDATNLAILKYEKDLEELIDGNK